MVVQGEGHGLVLVVDDDQAVREALQQALELDDRPTAIAPDGKKALEWLHQHGPPALILLDLMMPVMDGWQVLEQLREDERLRRVPIVILTAFGRELGTAAQFPILRKPVELQELLDVVGRYRDPPS